MKDPTATTAGERYSQARDKRRSRHRSDSKTKGAEVAILDPAKYDDRWQRDHEEQHREAGERILVLPPPSMPLAVARIFIENFRTDGEVTLRRWRGGWWRWETTRWVEEKDDLIESLLYRFTEFARTKDAIGMPVPWSPTKRKIADLAHALVGVTVLHSEIDQPCWLDGREITPRYRSPMDCSM